MGVFQFRDILHLVHGSCTSIKVPSITLSCKGQFLPTVQLPQVYSHAITAFQLTTTLHCILQVTSFICNKLSVTLSFFFEHSVLLFSSLVFLFFPSTPLPPPIFHTSQVIVSLLFSLLLIHFLFAFLDSPPPFSFHILSVPFSVPSTSCLPKCSSFQFRLKRFFLR